MQIYVSKIIGTVILDKLVELSKNDADLFGIGISIYERDTARCLFDEYVLLNEYIISNTEQAIQWRENALNAMNDFVQKMAETQPVGFMQYTDECCMMPDGEAAWIVAHGKYVICCSGSSDDEWGLDAAMVIASHMQNNLIYDRKKILPGSIIEQLDLIAQSIFQLLDSLPKNAQVLPAHFLFR